MEQPAPDTKDWTWVIDRECPECGFVAPAVDPDRVAALMRANAAAFRSALTKGDIVNERPPVPAGHQPKWSAIEYAAHVRDVYQVAADRLTMMLEETDPTFVDWNQDHAAIEGDYAGSVADAVSYALAVNAGRLADMLDRIGGEQWQRPGSRSDGASFTLATYAVYILHDVSHHLWDVEQGFEAIKELTED